MSDQLSDTKPGVEALQIVLLRQVSPARKMEMLAELNSAARMLSLVGLRSLYIHDNEAKIQRRLADLLLGEELAKKVYGGLEDAA